MLLYLTQKKVLRFEGEAEKFLNAYTTNTPGRPHTAFVDRQGRIVAMADQVLLNSEEALIVVEGQFTERLLEHLEPYRDFSRTQIRTDEILKIYFDLEDSYVPASGEWVITQKKGRLVLTPRDLPVAVREEEFKKFMLEHKISVQDTDFDDKALLRGEHQECVSYTKGCYLGQEILARVHFRSKGQSFNRG